MSSSYWDSLSDVLPADVIAAMSKACLAAIHDDAGRADEPALLAGVRALIAEMMPRSEHNALITQMANYQRHVAQLHEEELSRRVREVQADTQVDLARLDAVRGLAHATKKTMSVASLRLALGIDEAPASPEVTP